MHALACLRADQGGIFRRYADDLFDFMNDFRRIGGRQIDLIDDRQDLQALLQRGVAVGDTLGFDALRGIDHQQGPLAGRERAGNLVGEIDMTRRVDEIQLIQLARDGLKPQGDALGLDGDAALALQVHAIEHLSLHFPCIQSPALLDEAVRERGFAVVDVGNDGKIADILHLDGSL